MSEDTQQPESSESATNPDIKVDEDWKAQVEAEKTASAESESTEQRRERPPLPPASIATLITQFATQAAVALGQAPNPVTNTQEVDLQMAKYAVDLLEVLQNKTEGNLDDGEKQLLEAVLYDLRMAYVTVSSRPPQSATESEPEESPIITP